MPNELSRILICGKGLAFELTLAALNHKMPETLRIIAVELSDSETIDPFYGHVTSPDTLSFHKTIGIEEAEFLIHTDSSFSYGTHYKNWANKNWAQCHHLPFPVWENIPFVHYLTRSHQTLEPYLVNAECGKSQSFAHPPSDKNVPLSRAEYGYQVRPKSLTEFYSRRTQGKNIERVKGEFQSIERNDDQISSLTLKGGEPLTADFFIDASGSSAILQNSLQNDFEVSYSLKGGEYVSEASSPLQSLRDVKGTDHGWTSHTTLRNKQIVFTVSDPKSTQGTLEHSDENLHVKIGRRPKGWLGNCVGLGHASHIIESLTPAPMILLQRDITRLLSLMPVSTQMTVEAREFNRLRQDDLDHADIFHRAFFEAPDAPETPYWKAVKSSTVPQKLTRKIEQFESRGFLTNYDLDPFNEQDWMIQHFGIGRRPRRHDVFVEKFSETAIKQNLEHMRQTIISMAAKVPPHERYLTKFIQYLEKKNHAAQY